MKRPFFVASFVLAISFFVMAVGQLQLPSLPSLPTIPGLPSSIPNLPNLPNPATITPSITQPNVSADSAPASSSEKPDYSRTDAIFSLNDQRAEKILDGRPPYLEVIRKSKLQTFQNNREYCLQLQQKQQQDDVKCPKYEWSVPFSLESESLAAARDLRAAWQRFEDSYYWRVMVELNNPALYVAFCTLGISNIQKPSEPSEVSLTVLPESLPQVKDFGSLPKTDPKLRLDDYIPLPKVPTSDFCDDLNLTLLPLMYLPGFCIYVFGAKIVCTDELFPPQDGDKAVTGTSPLWFNREEAISRVQSSIARAHTTYLARYHADTIKALTPGDRSYFFPLPWASNLPGAGAIVAPIMNTNLDPSQFLALGQEANQRLGGLEALNALPYFFQNVVGRSPTLNLHMLPGRSDVVSDVPGVWKLEELKRFLKPSNLSYYEQFGYTNFFAAWNEMTTTVLPEDAIGKLARVIMYFAVGLDLYIDFSGFWFSGNVAPIPVEPFVMPFVGPRMSYTWFSVPEGYQIPMVKDDPLLDYRELLRTTR